jgi:hypothetical protein
MYPGLENSITEALLNGLNTSSVFCFISYRNWLISHFFRLTGVTVEQVEHQQPTVSTQFVRMYSGLENSITEALLDRLNNSSVFCLINYRNRLIRYFFRLTGVTVKRVEQ